MKIKLMVAVAMMVGALGLKAAERRAMPVPAQPPKETPPELVTGVVIAFSDEIRENYGCALVETDENVYEAIWYPLLQRDNVTMDRTFNFYCKKAPSTFKQVLFKIKERTTKNQVETLNPKKGDDSRESTIYGVKNADSRRATRQPEIIGDYGSTVAKHYFVKQLIAVANGPAK